MKKRVLLESHLDDAPSTGQSKMTPRTQRDSPQNNKGGEGDCFPSGGDNQFAGY